MLRTHRGRPADTVMARHAQRFLSESGQAELPIDVDGIASLLGIRRRTGPWPFAGRIYAEPNGQLVMDLNAEDAPPRRRFTCAHELMHSAFPGFRKEMRFRTDITVGRHPPGYQEEYLCDVGAAHLLMPHELVATRYRVSGGLRAVERLAKAAHVSLEASGNRLVDLATEVVAFVVLEVGNKPAEWRRLRAGIAAQPRLRTKYAVRGGISAYIPRYKSAEDDSIFVEALQGNGIVRGYATLPGAEQAGAFDIEVKSYPRQSGGLTIQRVLALATQPRPMPTVS
jgi:hypothetical protein